MSSEESDSEITESRRSSSRLQTDDDETQQTTDEPLTIHDIYKVFLKTRWHGSEDARSQAYCVVDIPSETDGGVKIFNNQPNKHAEICMLDKLQELRQQGELSDPVKLHVYSNYSPCYTCSNELNLFVGLNPMISICIIAAMPYKVCRPSCRVTCWTWPSEQLSCSHTTDEYRENAVGLALFNQKPQLLLRAFEAWEWQFTLPQLLQRHDPSSDKIFTTNNQKYRNDSERRSRYEQDLCTGYDFHILTSTQAAALLNTYHSFE